MNICSVLIPTRKRVPRLIKTIESVKSTSSESSVEICLRVDCDDCETIESIAAILRLHKQIVVLIGPRLGYARLHDYYNELVAVARSEWFFVMNDDITLEGDGWDKKLSLITGDKLAIPAGYKLGHSGYTDFGCGYVCPIVKIKDFQRHGPMGAPVDVWWMERIGGGMDKKANTVAIDGLCVNHQRDDYHAIEAHRND